MSRILDELRLAVESSGVYWESNSLMEAYLDSSILPKVRAALAEVLPTIEARHKFEPRDGKDEIPCAHYTSIGRLFEMLDEKRDIDKSFLKLYDSVHLNDPDEGNYLLRQLYRNGRHGWLRLDSSDLSETHESEVAYIISFVLRKDREEIEIGDNLVFWRTYGNEGRGCSLKFPISHESLKKVLYGERVNETIGVIEPILDAISPLFADAKQVPIAVRRKAINEITNSLKGILYLYKSSAYEYENEGRIVDLESEVAEDQIHFDYQAGSVGRPRIRHYIDFSAASLKTLLSSESIITIGPTVPHRENVREYLEKIKRKINLLGPQIKLSKIPYRLP